MKIPSHHDRDGQGEAMMTPMIDVVFLLLIFFLCTASFQIAEQLLPSSLLLSEAGASDVEIPPEQLDLERVVVKILWLDGQPQWIVNDEKRATLAEVRKVLAAVAQIDPGLPVVIDPAEEVELGAVIDAYDTSRLAGFTKIQFAASL